MTDPNRKLQPGDLISVDPTAVVTLQRPREASGASSSASSSSPESSATPDAAETDTAAAVEQSASDPAASPASASAASAPGARPLPFHLPDFAAPFLFIPPYLEPSF
ncbi:hypothetical protein JCM3774_000200, partial [Rhodotorula dairenensis]